MVQCEMCGTETDAPKTAKIEGAELQVCADCANFGTEVQTEEESETTTKYSTSSSGATSDASGGSTSSGGTSSGGTRSRRDIFDEMDEVATDYDQRIREGREAAGLTQAELADQLNEKTSFIRKLERGETLPNDTIRRKLERALEIQLVEGAGAEETEWSSDDDTTGMTLGDVVKRKD